MIDEIVQGLLAGNRRMLGKAITLVESKKAEHRAIADKLLDRVMCETGNSIRVGISGSPGVGKSTFIEAFGKELLNKDYKVAVLAVDPSSPINSGSILGDKTRMQVLSAHPNVFIRPSPAGSKLGGVANRTRETIFLCEAAGYNFIIIETVGVGQSEYLVNSMVDAFVFLQQPYSGDQLQGIKKGILELANIIAVNKADGQNLLAAQRAKTDLDLALNLIYQNQPDMKPHIGLVSALEETGVEDLVKSVTNFVDKLKTNGKFEEQRKQQAVDWFEDELKNNILDLIFSNDQFKRHHAETKIKVHNLEHPARQAAKELSEKFKYRIANG